MDLFALIDAAKDGLAWICLCVLSLIAAAYVLAGLRGAWRTLRARLNPFAVCVFAAVSVFATVEAQKRASGGASRTTRPARESARPRAPVTQEEIERGWRFVAETDCEAGVYAMPEGVSPSFNWHKRGTFGEWARLDLGGFTFPLGADGGAFTSFSVFNDGRIRPTPRDAAHEIRAVGVPMLAMQGASRFWTASGTDGSKLLTWENFFLHADTNAPINAQIELFASGDFTTRSNGVERIFCRIEPFDWDGDGLENSVDPDPLVAGPDAHGTNDEWYDAVCSGVANSNAYYFVDVVAERGPAPVFFTGDRESRLGDPVVVALAGETNRVPLLMGVEYAVTSSVPLDVWAEDGYAAIVTNNARNYTVSWPLSFGVAASQGGGYSIDVQPFDPGGEFSWAQRRVEDNAPYQTARVLARRDGDTVGCAYNSASNWVGFTCGSLGDCGCHGCSVDGTYSIEDALFALPSIWCGCVAAENEPRETNLSVSVSFDKPVVFYEDAYTNAPGDVVAKRSTRTTLSISACGGASGGVLSVSAQNLGKLVRVGGNAVSIPYEAVVPSNATVSLSVEYEASAHSASPDDISVAATIVPLDGGNVATDSDSATVAEILIEADVNFPTNRRRHVFGPAEWVKYSFSPPIASATLHGTVPSHGMHDNLQGRILMPFSASQFIMDVVDGNVSLPMPFTVIEPTANLFIDGVRLPSNEDWSQVMEVTPLQEGDIGSAFHVDMSLKPSHVSFAALGIMELYADATDIQGFFTNAVFYGHLNHDLNAGAFRPISVNMDNTVGTGDNVLFSLNGAFMPYLEYGTFKLEIPVVWYLKNENVTNNLVVLQARNTVYGNADVTVSKYTISAIRGTNNVTTISR